jgi:hypothetical protein
VLNYNYIHKKCHSYLLIKEDSGTPAIADQLQWANIAPVNKDDSRKAPVTQLPNVKVATTEDDDLAGNVDENLVSDEASPEYEVKIKLIFCIAVQFSDILFVQVLI